MPQDTRKKSQDTRRKSQDAQETEQAAPKPKRQNRQYVVELEEPRNHRLAYTLGALGGMALGAFLLRAVGGVAERAAPQPVRADDEGFAPEPSRPARLQRPPQVQDDILLLEDAVLDAFLDDEVLAERGIDVGAISEGIVELSGSVWTRGEAAHAVAVAQSVEGVVTVVNRMEIEAERARLHPRFDDSDEGDGMSGEWTGHQSGMGSRRQGEETDPSRRDDSHHQREVAMEQADRAQFEDEGVHSQPRVGDPHGDEVPNPTNFREDELDNQSPFGKRAVPQGSQEDGPPQALNTQSRVGEGLKPGVELALEKADLPLKPHQDPSRDRERGV
jgi:hypothetical protein